MAVQVMLVTIVLTAATSGASAQGTCTQDAKNESRPDWQFKTSLADRWCSSSESSFASCDSACCEKKKDLCGEVFGGRACKDAVNTFRDTLKDSTKTTDETANVDCCSPKKKCDTTCSTGYKNKANYATIECFPVCSIGRCCDEVDTCAGGKDRKLQCNAGWNYKGSADANGVTAANFNTKCCQETKTCDGWHQRRGWTCKKTDDVWDEHYVPLSAKDTGVVDDDEAKWETACCTARVIKCSEYTECHARAGEGWVHDLAKDAEYCMTGEGFGSTKWKALKKADWHHDDAGSLGDTASLCPQVCCKADKLKCRGYPGPHEGMENCNINYHEYLDLKTKAGNPVADDAAFRGACCSKQLSCQHFQTPEAAIGGQHTLVVAPFLVVVGILALSN